MSPSFLLNPRNRYKLNISEEKSVWACSLSFMCVCVIVCGCWFESMENSCVYKKSVSSATINIRINNTYFTRLCVCLCVTK